MARRPLMYLRMDTEVFRRCKAVSERTGRTLVDVVEELLARQLNVNTSPPPQPVTFDQALAEVARDDAAA